MNSPLSQGAEPALLPCPFCGAVDGFGHFGGLTHRFFHVTCKNCGCEGPGYFTGASPSEHWNRRAAPPLPEGWLETAMKLAESLGNVMGETWGDGENHSRIHARGTLRHHLSLAVPMETK